MKPVLLPGVLWSLDELSAPRATALLASAQALARGSGPHDTLRGRHMATLGGAAGGPSTAVFAAAALALGARVTRVHPVVSVGSRDDDLRDSAPWLGRLYDAIGCDGMSETAMQNLARQAGVPVHNDLAAARHPTRLLADVLAMQRHAGCAVSALRLAVIDDAQQQWSRAWTRLAPLTGLEVQVRACEGDVGGGFDGGADFVFDARQAGSGSPPGLLARPVQDRAPHSLEAARRLQHHYVVQALLVGAWH